MEAVPRRALGRPRSEQAQQAILRAALELVSAKGFRAITVDQIAARAGTGKMTLYRRWPNKAALVMDALLQLVGPQTDFPPSGRAVVSLQKQLHLQVDFFRGKYGLLLRSLLAEAQSDEELAEAFREGWLYPRRAGVLGTLRLAIEQGDLREDIDLEAAIDMLYGPLYYRLLLGTGALNGPFVERVYAQFLAGHRARKR